MKKRELEILIFWQLCCEDMSIEKDDDDLPCERCEYYEDCQKLRKDLGLGTHH